MSDILNKYLMSKSDIIVNNLISIVQDGLHNSKKVPIDLCEDYLRKTKFRLE